jgi:hypothetical protein
LYSPSLVGEILEAIRTTVCEEISRAGLTPARNGKKRAPPLPKIAGRSRRRTGGTEPDFAARVDQRKAHQGEQARGGSATGATGGSGDGAFVTDGES